MKKIVRIENIMNNRKFQASFLDREEERIAWIANMENNAKHGNGWGWGPREMSKEKCIEKELQILIIEEYEKLIMEERKQAIWELTTNGDYVFTDVTYIDDDGKEQTIKARKQAVDKEGKLKFETIEAVYETWVKLKADYTIEIIDVTNAHEEELALKASRKSEIKNLKLAASEINGWNNMSDINLPFLKKFFKRILKEMRD